MQRPFVSRRGLIKCASLVGLSGSPFGRRAYAGDLKGDGIADDSDALERLFLEGGTLTAPQRFYRTTRTLRLGKNVAVRGEDRSVKIKLSLPPASPAVPVILIPEDAVATELSNLSIDGGANSGGGMISPTGHDIAGRSDPNWGSSVIVRGSEAFLDRLIVENAWDNGISVFASDGVQIVGVVGRSNGLGSGGGACVDVSAGTNAVVRGCQDHGSATGFIFDIGAGANGILSDTISSRSRNLGFYIGAADSQLANLRSDFSGGIGFWIDAADQRKKDADGTTTSYSRVQACNLLAYRPAKQAYLIKTGQLQLTNAVAIDAGSEKADAFDAFEIDTDIDLHDVDLVNCAAYGTRQRWGLARRTASASASGQIIGGSWYGSAGGLQPGALAAPEVRR